MLLVINSLYLYQRYIRFRSDLRRIRVRAGRVGWIGKGGAFQGSRVFMHEPERFAPYSSGGISEKFDKFK